MKKPETKGWIVGLLVGAVVALVVVGVVAYHGVGLGWLQPERQLVSSGVQSVTLCGERYAGAYDLTWIPDVKVGIWGWEKTKGDCYVFSHYTGAGD